MNKDKQMLNFLMPMELLKKIDDFRFGHRFASRAEAIKWLLKYALDHNPVPPEDGRE